MKAITGGRGAALGAAWAVLCVTSRAAAGPPVADLTLTRAPAAADCPDAEALGAAVRATTGRDDLSLHGDASIGLHLAVSIERGPAGYHATLRASGTRSGTRRLDDIGTSCEGLASALTVTLALLVDDEAAAVLAPASVPLPPPPSVVAPSTRASRASTRQAPASQVAPDALAVALGTGAAIGVVGSATPLLELGAEWRSLRASARAGGVWIPGQGTDVVPGRIVVSLVGGYARGCLHLAGEVRHGFALCAESVAARLSGEGQGFGTDRSSDRAWVAWGGGAHVWGALSHALGWEVDLRGWVPLREQRFVVGGLGVVHDPPPFGLVATFGVAWSIL